MVKQLCMAGAASRGLCYLGALEHLTCSGLLDDLEIIAGVSIGSLIAVCYVIGFSPIEMFEMLLWKDTNELRDISLDYVLNQGSVLKGDKYKTWVWDLLSEKTDPLITFEDIYTKFNKKLLITATCLQDGLTIFSTEKTPTMPIYYAVMSSMALPFIFPPIVYNHKNYVDGGVLNNFPVKLLDPNKSILGLKVTSKDINNDYTSVFTYVSKLFQLISNQTSKLHGEIGKVIIIECKDYNFIDFDMSIDDKITLYKRGYRSIDSYVCKEITHGIVNGIIEEVMNLKTPKTPKILTK
jgi:predicted acylesterase/phospholipase RssA